MPYKRKGLKAKRVYKKRPMTATAVRSIARKAVTSMAETKQLYTEVDELTVTPGTVGAKVINFMNLKRQDTDDVTPLDGSRPYREGQQVKPMSFTYNGWIRPRALDSDGTPAEQGDNFKQALYLRVIFLYTDDSDPTARTPDSRIDPSQLNFFIGQGGLPTDHDLNYSDIYKPLNWRVTGKPLMDKVFFIPNQYQMNNTKLIKFRHTFGRNEKTNYPANSTDMTNSAPLKGLKMYFIARYADDDTHLTYENLEASGTGIFKFKDF